MIGIADAVPGFGMGKIYDAREGFRQQLRNARYFAGQGDLAQAQRRFSEVMNQYAADPAAYAGLDDEIENTRYALETPEGRAEAAASAGALQQGGANARPEGSGSVWIDTIMNVPGAVAERTGEIYRGEIWSDEQCRVLGMRRDDATGKCAPHPTGWLPSFSCASLPGPLAWACENPKTTAGIAAGFLGLWIFGPPILAKVMQTRRALS